MTAPQTRPALPLERVALGGGLGREDYPVLERSLRPLLIRLAAYRVRTVEVSVKDRDGRGMQTTGEVWVGNLPRLVATSSHPDLEPALTEVASRLVAQLEESKTRRQPRNNRKRRDSIRGAGPRAVPGGGDDPHTDGPVTEPS